MELQKIRNLSDEELAHHEKTTADQLFRLRFQVTLGQNDAVKKLRLLRKEIAQIKTVARERELGIHGETKEAKQAAVVAETAQPKAEEAVSAVKTKAPKAPKTKAAAATATARATKTAAKTKTKTAKAKGARK